MGQELQVTYLPFSLLCFSGHGGGVVVNKLARFDGFFSCLAGNIFAFVLFVSPL